LPILELDIEVTSLNIFILHVKTATPSALQLCHVCHDIRSSGRVSMMKVFEGIVVKVKVKVKVNSSFEEM
jgi:hypothetical protein